MSDTQDILDYLSKIFRSGDATTPRHIVGAMLDMLPKDVFADPTKTFLCPATKDGVFLREILRRIIAAYRKDAAQRPDVARHISTATVRQILETRIFGIALTYKDYMMSRRTLYGCTDDENEIGYRDIDNIFYDTSETLSEPQKDKLGNLYPYQYTFIKMDEYLQRAKRNEVELLFQVKGENDKILFEQRNTLYNNLLKYKNMKFDVIIGNPPYQQTGGSGGNNDSPVYQFFVEQAIAHNAEYISMIMPSRWMAGGRENLLGDFRQTMLTNRNLQFLVDYPDSNEVFPMVEIKGGVCYFLLNKNYNGDCEYSLSENGQIIEKNLRNLNEFDILIRRKIFIDVVKKVNAPKNKNVSSIISNDTPFGIPSNPRTSTKNPFEVHDKQGANDILLYHIENQKRKIEFIDKRKITKNAKDIKKWKVIMPGSAEGHQVFPQYTLAKPEIAQPNSVCSQSYLYASFESEEQCQNFVSYYKTKFFRFLVAARKISQSAPKRVYQFVPLQDFSESWTDAKLYAKYGLTEEEIAFIESMIRPMSNSDADIIEEIEEDDSDE
jgi:site-specific DNA-methyltransferase (adenine-specific)